VLTRVSNLLSGSSVGADPTASDGTFETLKVTESGQTAVLVTSGNSTFMTAADVTCWNFLHTLLNELRRAPKR